ncbi:VOC family protein [Henriciella marina]|uniref:VOC family protein n=1 Tax=Henriciella marina TaxID=453851 RepID=UPI00035E4191|nr:VOC family protein [Henriciella marina]
MIAYSTLGTNDMDRSIEFYDAVFGAIGGSRELTTPEWTQYGRKGERAKVCLTPPHDGNKATRGNGAMLAFETTGRSAVDAFHAAALTHGGADAGQPGIREGTHYVAYVHDPDGNKLCAFAAK